MSRPGASTPEELVRELAADAGAVSRIPRPAAVAAGAIVLGLAVFAAHWALGGPAPRHGTLDAVRVLVFGGVALAAAGGIGAALVSAVPGRERAARAGIGVLAVGSALAATAAALAWARGDAQPLPLAVAVACALRAAALGVLPALAAWGFAARAWPARPVRTAVLGALGSLSLGASAVHASCVAAGGRHVLLGHALGPLALALLVAVPAALWLARRAARRL